MPLDNFILAPASKRVDQSLSDFQTDTGLAAHATLDTEHHISCTRGVLVDTIANLKSSVSGMIVASEVHELLTKIHDILHNAVSK